MTYSFKTVGEVNKSDIQRGDAWVFDGWPEPPVEGDDFEKYDNDFAKALDENERIERAVNQKLCKAEKPKGGHK